MAALEEGRLIGVAAHRRLTVLYTLSDSQSSVIFNLLNGFLECDEYFCIFINNQTPNFIN